MKIVKKVGDFVRGVYSEVKRKERFSPVFRACAKLQDVDAFLLFVKRVLGRFENGTAFLEELKMEKKLEITKSGFFQLFQSGRRCSAIKKMSEESFKQFELMSSEFGVDYLKEFPELKDYAVINGDGHFIENASHTEKTRGKSFAAGSIYIQSVRTGNLHPLATVSDGSKKNHEMPIFRKAIENMPSDYFGLSKTLWVLDRGFIDNYWWGFMKEKGHFFISKAKDNFNPIKLGIIGFDKDNPINKGVKGCYIAGFSSGWTFTVVDYEEPETGECFSFVTFLDCFEINPGLIVFLYFKRWNIEKAFDNAKNTLFETKAWATGKNALEIQSHAIAFAYNLLRTTHEQIIVNEEEKTVSEIKYEKSLGKRSLKASKEKRQVSPWLFFPRMMRIPSVFVRCFRKCFFDNVDIDVALRILKLSLYTKL